MEPLSSVMISGCVYCQTIPFIRKSKINPCYPSMLGVVSRFCCSDQKKTAVSPVSRAGEANSRVGSKTKAPGPRSHRKTRDDHWKKGNSSWKNMRNIWISHNITWCRHQIVRPNRVWTSQHSGILSIRNQRSKRSGVLCKNRQAAIDDRPLDMDAHHPEMVS